MSTLTSGVLEREAALVHLVLLDVPARKMVDLAGAVDLHLQLGRVERPLLADEDVEVVVGGVHAGVALRAHGGAEDDEVLGDARVDDVHRAHRAAGVAQHPLGGVGVQGDRGGRVFGGEVGDDVGDYGVDVIWMGGDGRLREFVQIAGVEDIPPVL